MADWIELRSAELKSLKAEHEQKRASGAEAVDQLEMAVRRDVAKWNELNPSYRRHIDGVKKLMRSGAFRICKTSFPPAMVDAVLDPDSSVITVEITTVRPGEKKPHTDYGRLLLRAEENGFGLMLQSGKMLSLTDASQVLLEPIIASIS